MKTKILLFSLLCLAYQGMAQTQLPDTTGLTLDGLQIPSSPAFSLMDLAPSTIDEPKVPSDFALSLRQATDSFTTWPKSYGIEFAPAWVFGRNKIDFQKFSSNKLGNNIWQSLTLSAGINHLDDPDLPAGNGRTTQLGFGLKMSLARGHIQSSHQKVDSLYLRLGELNDEFYKNTEAQLQANARYKFWDDSLNVLKKQTPIDVVKLQVAIDSINAVLAIRNAANADLGNSADDIMENSTAYAALKSQLTGLKLNRRGFKLDFATGMVRDFYDQSVDSAKTTRIGAWLTGGWVFDPTDNQLNASVLGILRIIGNPDQLYRHSGMNDALMTADNLYFDYGTRVILHNGKRFSFSAEVLGRIPINNDGLKPTSRYVVNADYQVSKTITLSFNIGKNFDGTVNKSGNLITAIQMFTALGKRGYDSGKML